MEGSVTDTFTAGSSCGKGEKQISFIRILYGDVAMHSESVKKNYTNA